MKLTGGGSVVIDSVSVLVKPEIARAQQAAEGEPMEGSTDPGDGTEANLSNGRMCGGLLKERWLLVESSD